MGMSEVGNSEQKVRKYLYSKYLYSKYLCTSRGALFGLVTETETLELTLHPFNRNSFFAKYEHLFY